MQSSLRNLARGAFLRPILVLALVLNWGQSAKASGTVTNASLTALQTALQGGGTVILSYTGTITTTSAFQITNNTTMYATTSGAVISGGNSTRIFHVDAGATFSVTNVTLMNGNSTGTNGANGANGSSGGGTGGTGGNGNLGGSGMGGAIYNQGTTILVNCSLLTNNAAGGDGGKGGNGGNGTLGGSGGNGGNGGTGFGGAIYNGNALVLSNCTIAGNTASGGDGGLGGTNGTPVSFAYTGSGGTGATGAGAGVYNATDTTSTIVACTFNNNTCLGGASQAVTDKPDGGGDGQNGPNGADSDGGAIFNWGTNATINCTFYRNIVTGGSGGNGGNAATGPNAGIGGNGGNGNGGSVYNGTTGFIGVTNCTFAAGTAYGGGPGSNGTGADTNGSGSYGTVNGANIFNTGGTFNLKNTILAYPTNTTCSSGTIANKGNNMSSDATPAFGSNGFNNTNAHLASLQNNGGPTMTMALQSNSPAIGKADNSAAPALDQRGYWWTGTSDIGAYESSGVPEPTVALYALGASASEDGDVGMFLIARTPGGPGPSLTVNYTQAGTATNGVNCTSLPSSVTIPADVGFVKILVQCVPGTFSGTNLTVTWSLSTNAQYQVDSNNNTGTVVFYPQSTFDPSARFVRGTSTAPDFQSFVLPLDSEAGVAFPASGGIATNLFPGNPWTTNSYHYDATNANSQVGTNSRIVFQNPIAAFGVSAGPAPLYLNQTYHFGISAGDTSSNFASALRIQVYYRSNSAHAGTIGLPIPDPSNASQLTTFANNGFTVTTNAFGLMTVLTAPDYIRWGVLLGSTFTLAHRASSAATNYYYVIENQGFCPDGNYMVLNAAGAAEWSRLYALEFTPFPAGRSIFVDQPHFDSIPLPPAYQGKSVSELTNVVPTLPDLSSLNPSNYLTIDGSPELRRHPILDGFVADMNNDPLALANYVINEIGLIDAIDYDTNYNSQPAVNLGGVNRGALATFQEGQGSPVEQCALLIYLLRQAGVPACYVYPASGGLEMLDSEVGKLLRVQLNGAVDDASHTNLPQQISVNYPWVGAFVGGQWVQVFPWLKDVEIAEGFNLYDYMPTNYNSGYKWLTHFITNDPNIFSLSSSDQPLDLLPLFIQSNLDLNFPGVSVDDLGVQIVNRRHLYSQWSDFPVPFSLSGTPQIIESLSTNLNLFNTLDVLVYSQANTNKYIDTGEMRVLDFHDRKLFLKFVQVGTNNVHNMILTLSSYSTNITSQTNFGAGIDSTWVLSSTNQLNSTDDAITVQTTHRRNKFLPSGYVPPSFYDSVTNLWHIGDYELGEVGAGQVYVQTNGFRKGDMLAFCLDVGRVSQRMLDTQAQEIWQYNLTATTNNANPDIYLGTTMYLMALSYFNYYDRFTAFDSPLHKAINESSYQSGFGLIRPKRDAFGNLPTNGMVIPIWPAIHIPDGGQITIFNGTSHANSSDDYWSATYDWWLQQGVQGSAAEHGVLRGFYQTNAISTVKLLQQVGTNMVVLNALNYKSAATNVYHGVQLQNADTNMWNNITNFFASSNYQEQVFMTPGVVTNGAYVGVGAMLFNNNWFASVVGGLNGGFNSYPFPDDTTSAANSIYWTAIPAPDGDTSAYISINAPQANNPSETVDGATTSGAMPATAASLANGTAISDPNWQQTAANVSILLSVVNSVPVGYDTVYLNQGALDTTVPTYNDSQTQAAEPVNVMTGEFYVDSVDLTLPGPLNLQVRRNYGSQNMVENQFGFGWKMNYMPFLSLNTNGSLIYAAEMDGSLVAYRQTNAGVNLWVPTVADNPMLDNNSSMGIGSVANLFNNYITTNVTPGQTNYILTGADGSVRTFLWNSFPIGSFSRARPYLNTWQDNRGNAFAFGYGTNSSQPDWGQMNRIQSANGNFIGFYYDLYGHITEAYTGDGRILQYVYDKFGDLITVTLPDQSQINYVYQHLNQVTNSVTNVYSTHLMLQQLTPNGRVLQNAYDSQRRVTNQMATAGSDLVPIITATFAYTNNFSLSAPTNQVSGVTAVRDYTNNVTTYFYTNSLIDIIVDPLNQTITNVWYGANTNGGYQRSLKSHTDKRGLVTTNQYDLFGNVVTNIVSGDLTGNGVITNAISSAVYNSNNLPLQVIDPIGNQKQIVYSTSYPFLPQQVIQMAGSVPVVTNLFVYTNATNVVTDGDETATNTAFGLLTRTIRAYGSPDAATNDLFYNGQGFVTNSVQYTGTGDPAITNQLFYDDRGELVQRTDAAGRSYTFLYDPMGRPAGNETFDIGQSTPMDWNYLYYNANGELNWIDGPRYNPEDYVWRDYDGAGRKIQEIHWRSQANTDGSGVSAAPGYNLYATSFYQYDPLGDLVQSTDPLGNYVVQSFDAVSQLTQQVYYASNGTAMATNCFAHEPGGLVSYATNALGAITTNLYTSKGQIKFKGNPDGSTHLWLYDLTGRVVQQTLVNGNFWTNIYDDSDLRVTNIFNNGSGPLATNVTQLDHRGNVVKKTDPLGNVFTNLYDSLNRIKVAAGPDIATVANTGLIPGTNFVTNTLQHVTTYIYDGTGQVITTSNALGEITATTNDPLGRPICVAVYNSGGGAAVRVTSTFYSPDHNSMTKTDGTGTNAIVTTMYTDTAGRPLLKIGYPTNGVTEFTWWQYDMAGNCIAQQQCSSNASSGITVWATNGWTYDGLNRKATETTKDGATTSFSYDALGDVTNRAMPGGLNWSATYFNDGRINSEEETGGGLMGRSMTYSYYPAGNSFAGMLASVIDGRSTTRSNSYDNFLRLASVTTTGSLTQQQILTTYQYDLRNLLTNLTQSFATNTTGPSTALVRSYDSYGQMVGEAMSLASNPPSSIQQGFDAAGRRTALGGTPFNYQADGRMVASDGSVFSYANNGLLMVRSNASRYYSVNQRDGRGRILQTTTTVGFSNALTEALTWRNDGRLSAYTAVRGDFTDSRNYSYSGWANRLTQESFNVSSSQMLTNVYTIDNGVTGGLGIVTAQAESGAASGTWSVPSSGGLDGLSRVAASQDTTITRPAYGTAQGAGTVSATLDGDAVGVQFDGPNGSGQWRANLNLTPGSHTLAVSAVDPSGLYSGGTNSTFTVTNTASDTIFNVYDGNGNVSQRYWTNSLGQTNRSQTLTWDAFDRLIGVVDRDAFTNGFNWSAIYDGLGRRVRTINVIVVSNSTVTMLNSSNEASQVDSTYDPQVEFLEVGVTVNGAFTAKTYGPDANGVYGGMQGVGGLESLYIIGHSSAVGSVEDFFGNVIGTITDHTVTWTPARFSGYGPVPGYQQTILSLNNTLEQVVGWRGKRVDETGFIYFGARHYDPVGCRFLNADPMGHGASMDLYSYCGGDPVNFGDWDGRCSQPTDPYLQYDSRRSSPTFAAAQNIAWTIEEGADAVINAGMAALFTPQGMDPNFTVQHYGNWLLNSGAYVPSQNNAQIQQTSASAGTAVQNAMIAYYAGQSTAQSANIEVPAPDYNGPQTTFYGTPDGTTIPATGYRALTGQAALDAQSGTILPGKNNLTYVSFDNISDMPADAAAGAVQIPYIPTYVAVFDTLQIANNLRIPNENWNTGMNPEPIATSNPQYGPGGATQAITSQIIQGVATLPVATVNAPTPVTMQLVNPLPVVKPN